jgi:hypothetical protein
VVRGCPALSHTTPWCRAGQGTPGGTRAGPPAGSTQRCNKRSCLKMWCAMWSDSCQCQGLGHMACAIPCIVAPHLLGALQLLLLTSVCKCIAMRDIIVAIAAKTLLSADSV